MEYLEFKRLALSDPYNETEEFIQKKHSCVECANYLNSVKKLDADLADSLDVTMPADMMARLKLTTEMLEQDRVKHSSRRYALVASVMLAVFVGLFFGTGRFVSQETLSGDYQELVSAVMEHVDEKPMTPVWSSQQANKVVSTLMASYDDQIKFKEMEKLRFGRICPMGKYRGLHATMQTKEGQVTFAYIKGEPVGDLINMSYKGYMSRVKPVKGGNVIIISKTDQAIEEVDEELSEAMYWDI